MNYDSREVRDDYYTSSPSEKRNVDLNSSEQKSIRFAAMDKIVLKSPTARAHTRNKYQPRYNRELYSGAVHFQERSRSKSKKKGMKPPKRGSLSLNNSQKSMNNPKKKLSQRSRNVFKDSNEKAKTMTKRSASYKKFTTAITIPTRSSHRANCTACSKTRTKSPLM